MNPCGKRTELHLLEKAGTGTLDRVTCCKAAGLPDPDFEQRGGQFVVTFWRDWLTDEVLAELHLNERQKKIIVFLKSSARITNTECQNLTGAARKTTSRDLEDLVNASLLIRMGVRRGTYYILSQNKNRGSIGEDHLKRDR